jgi:hypothetical protein
MQFEKRSEAQTEPVTVCLGESGAKRAIQQKSRLEIGAGGGEFNPSHEVSEVEAAAVIRRSEESLQTAAQVGGLADVGLGLGIVSAKQEYCGGRWSEGKGLGVAGGPELEALS